MLRKTVISLVLGCASSWCGAWDLQAAASTFNFVSVKKDTIGEVLHFKKLSGQIDKNGKAGITIDLNSVDTGVQIRDERMREFLFETGKYPSATYQANVDPSLLDKLAVGEVKTVSLEGTLNLHGQSAKLPAKVSVVKTRDGLVQVNTLEPVLVNAEQFGMTAGVAKLMELVNLPSISSVTPVTFSLVFANAPAQDRAMKARDTQ